MIEPGAIVVLRCANPKERFWGVLLDLSQVGITVRGIAVEAFEDLLRQCVAGGAELLGPVTLFVPLQRVERAELDETVGAVEGLAQRFERLTGVDPRSVLLGGSQRSDDDRPQM